MVQIKNKKLLHRYVALLTENIVQKSTFDQNTTELRSDIKVLTETMKLGFEGVDKRFEAVDKRFEDMYKYMDKRFTMMFSFMNIGFSILIIITILFKFLQ